MPLVATWESEHSLGVDERFWGPGRTRDPVVVFLDPRQVRDAALKRPADYDIKAERLINVRDMIQSDDRFMPPLVLWFNGRLQFENGRHRSEYCFMKRYESAPYVTARHMAKDLDDRYGASEAQGILQFDMSAFERIDIYVTRT